MAGIEETLTLKDAFTPTLDKFFSAMGKISQKEGEFFKSQERMQNNYSSINRDINNLGQTASRAVNGGVSRLLTSVIAIGGAYVGINKLNAALKESIAISSVAQNTANMFEVPEQAAAFKQWAKNSGDKYGVSTKEMLTTATSFGKVTNNQKRFDEMLAMSERIAAKAGVSVSTASNALSSAIYNRNIGGVASMVGIDQGVLAKSRINKKLSRGEFSPFMDEFSRMLNDVGANSSAVNSMRNTPQSKIQRAGNYINNSTTEMFDGFVSGISPLLTKFNQQVLGIDRTSESDNSKVPIMDNMKGLGDKSMAVMVKLLNDMYDALIKNYDLISGGLNKSLDYLYELITKMSSIVPKLWGMFTAGVGLAVEGIVWLITNFGTAIDIIVSLFDIFIIAVKWALQNTNWLWSAMITGLNVISFTLNYVLINFNKFSGVLKVVGFSIVIVIAALLAYKLSLLLVIAANTAFAIAQGLATVASGVYAAALGVATGSMSALNVVTYLFPGTWIVVAIMAVVAALAILIVWLVKVATQSESTFGTIVGSISAFGTIIMNILKATLAFLLIFSDGLINIFNVLSNFLIGVFQQPLTAIANLFIELGLVVLNIATSMSGVIDTVLGTKLGNSVDGVMGKLKSFQKEFNDARGYETSFDVTYNTSDAMGLVHSGVKDSYNRGYDWASSMTGELSGLLEIGSFESMVNTQLADIADINLRGNDKLTAINYALDSGKWKEVYLKEMRVGVERSELQRTNKERVDSTTINITIGPGTTKEDAEVIAKKVQESINRTMGS